MRYVIRRPGAPDITDPEWRTPADVMRSSHGHGVRQMPGALVAVPERIQRQRTAGWRAPLGTIYVGRPTPWGNPFAVARTAGGLFPRDDAVRMYRELVVDGATWWGSEGDRHQFVRTDRRGPLHVPTIADIRRVLSGHDLACWCPLKDADGKPVPCHADVLLELANE